ncbi:MAG TPA: acyl-ACP desaturase, partial [Bacteroidota bacterium]|nr:acyl-ACP desaturase [Bacteroidota bacterium]
MNLTIPCFRDGAEPRGDQDFPGNHTQRSTMEIHTPVERTAEYDARSKAEVLGSLASVAEELMKDHLEKRKLWFPSDFLPADEQMSDDQEAKARSLRERAKGIPDAVRVSLTLNLLTEEGLPHFHRLLATHL